ncbi:hypothetical protein BC936DRAFT_148568 [Jimgerdemannia flammicorona]|uniref:Uncharacterized protein n=2 Tax=Jimgerdemannia flammicorona TaxID=994334 RepID=A0A433D2T2_9FUNG|nr:hypothetical protein BC936DRAFT_148568 [Jimgerdemannia flammicorona]RUS26130.1 hypothetical protein BC938DRAFT_471195 [Jimgerdemannia flammicorona]
MSVTSTSFVIEDIVGSILGGMSLVLTTHSLMHMAFLQRSASKYHLFPIINISMLVNEVALLLLVFADTSYLQGSWAMWLNTVNNVSYFVVKPIILYMAYLRCRAVWPPYRRANHFHFFMVVLRAVELFVVLVINIAANVMCDGEYFNTRCEPMYVIWRIRDGLAPVFRFYYIISEAIFYVKLFQSLDKAQSDRNRGILRFRRLQTFLFGIDLVILLAMSIYRLIILWRSDLPTYQFVELASTALTIFNLTEFGLTMRDLFGYGSSRSDSAPGHTFSLPERGDRENPFKPSTYAKSAQPVSPLKSPSISIPSPTKKPPNYGYLNDLNRSLEEDRKELTSPQGSETASRV